MSKVHKLNKKHNEIALNDYCGFIEAYGLANLASQPNFKDRIKPSHHTIYPLLIWRMHLQQIKLWKKEPQKEQLFIAYFNESISDLSISFFIYTQGIYKPAALMLRSAIENFCKAVALANNFNDVITLTSTTEVFNKVAISEPVQSISECEDEFNKLKSTYSELCKSVHTANEDYMDAFEALKVLPQFIKGESDYYLTNLESVTRSFLAIISILLKEHFHKIHFSHKDLITKKLHTKIRRILNR